MKSKISGFGFKKEGSGEKAPAREGQEYKAVIKVLGVGGAGCNALNRMISLNVSGVEYIAVNTDAQALKVCRASTKLRIGRKTTRGLGTGSNPEVGRQAALEDTDPLIEAVEGADMVFVTAGLGGGTGTGAAPVISSLAGELGALVVAVVTKPFTFEGKKRNLQADQGNEELHGCVDTVITIPNDRILLTAGKLPLVEAFKKADDVLRQAVQGIADLITIPGDINLDFADVKTIMHGKGAAVMGIGTAVGEDRAREAARKAISSPLIEESSIENATGILINVTGGDDLTLHEVVTAAEIVREAAHNEANIIFGRVVDDSLTNTMKMTVIATGFQQAEIKGVTETTLSGEETGTAEGDGLTVPEFGSVRRSAKAGA